MKTANIKIGNATETGVAVVKYRKQDGTGYESFVIPKTVVTKTVPFTENTTAPVQITADVPSEEELSSVTVSVNVPDRYVNVVVEENTDNTVNLTITRYNVPEE